MERLLDETVLHNPRLRHKARSAVDDDRKDIPGLFPPEPILEEIYREYNIVRIDSRRLVAVAQSLGPLDLPAVLSGQKPLPPESQFKIGSNVDDLKQVIDGVRGVNLPEPTFEESYRGFHIIRVGNMLVAFAKQFGSHRSFAQALRREGPLLGRDVLIGWEIAALRTQIDATKMFGLRAKTLQVFRKVMRRTSCR